MVIVKCRLLNTLYHNCKISSNHCHLMLYEIERPQEEQDVRYIVVMSYRCLSNRILKKMFSHLGIARRWRSHSERLSLMRKFGGSNPSRY